MTDEQMNASREIAAQCWCDPETSGIPMDARLAEAFAKRLATERAARQQAEAMVAVMATTLEFYADPETYCAIGFAFDPPCGEFRDDFDLQPDLQADVMRPGKRARAALSAPPTALEAYVRAMEAFVAAFMHLPRVKSAANGPVEQAYAAVEQARKEWRNE